MGPAYNGPVGGPDGPAPQGAVREWRIRASSATRVGSLCACLFSYKLKGPVRAQMSHEVSYKVKISTLLMVLLSVTNLKCKVV